MGQALSSAPSPQTTVIIPTYNEADTIENTISAIHSRKSKPVEIIVADGYSSDRTVRLARRKGAKVIRVRGGRARQQNIAAQQVKTPYILFLHADTTVPFDFDSEIISQLATSTSTSPSSTRASSAGAFRLRIANTNDYSSNSTLHKVHNFSFRVVETAANWRSSVLQKPYGDQGLFFTTQFFRKIGGFPDMPFLEDYEITRRVSKARSRIALSNLTVTTSSRRWDSLGVLQTTLMNQLVIAGYHFGVPVEKLRSWYRNTLIQAGRKRGLNPSTICTTPRC